MRVRELIRYSEGLLRGRRLRTTLVCLMPAAAEIFFRTAEACVYVMLLYFGGAAPIALFSGENILQPLITAGFAAVRWTAAAPLSYAAAYRLCGICSGRPDAALSDVLADGRSIRRSIAALIWTKLAGLLAVAPAVFFGITAYSLFTEGGGTFRSFMTLHAAALTVISVGIWLSVKLSMVAVPYLLAEYPQKSAFRTVLLSLRLMSGRRVIFIRLIFAYLPAMLTVIAAPFALAGLKTAFAQSIDIFIREEEYRAGDKNNCGHRKACRSAKLPTRKKRRFKAAADEAQTL